jgi:hypothetical protein
MARDGYGVGPPRRYVTRGSSKSSVGATWTR